MLISRIATRGAWLVALVATCAASAPQDRSARLEEPAPSNRRLALVIGNATYRSLPVLTNPVNDATDLTAALRTLQFDVTSAVDTDRLRLRQVITTFVDQLRRGNLVLVFYSGHGIQVQGDNYLVPVDFEARDEATAMVEGYSAGVLHDQLVEHGAGVRILILDACRNNPFRISRSAGGGLAAMNARTTGSFFAFATGPGATADDNARGRNGLYTSYLLEGMRQPGLTIREMFDAVGRSVSEASNQRQIPWVSTSLYDPISLNPDGKVIAATAVLPAPAVSGGGPAVSRAADMDISLATSLLDRATKSRDGSVQGQNDAIASLLARGFEFNDADWNGLTLRRAVLARGRFTGLRLHFGDLSDADARGADFSNSGLRFATLPRAVMADAKLGGAYAPFVAAEGANFERADLAGANLAAGNLRKVNFKKASLRGAILAFANLRGAMLDDADLTGAFLVGALIDDTTSLTGAIFKDTDILGATAGKARLTPAQRAGACRHTVGVGRDGLPWHVRLVEQWPSNKYSTGFEYEELRTTQGTFQGFDDRTLPLCSTRGRPDESYSSEFPGSIGMNLDREYLVKAGRRAAAVARVEAHYKLLTAMLGPEHALKGDSSQRARWEAYIRGAAAKTAPVGEPYLGTDRSVLLLLSAGIITPRDAGGYARGRYEAEATARKDGAPLVPEFFPPDAPWADLPAGTTDLFQQWMVARAASMSKRLVLRAVQDPKAGDSPLAYFFASTRAPNFFETTLRDSQIEPTRAYVALGQIVIIYPSSREAYHVQIPDAAAGTPDAWVEMDVTIEKMEAKQGSSEALAFVYVAPGEVRVRTRDRVVWKGTFRP